MTTLSELITIIVKLLTIVLILLAPGYFCSHVFFRPGTLESSKRIFISFILSIIITIIISTTLLNTKILFFPFNYATTLLPLVILFIIVTFIRWKISASEFITLCHNACGNMNNKKFIYFPILVIISSFFFLMILKPAISRITEFYFPLNRPYTMTEIGTDQIYEITFNVHNLEGKTIDYQVRIFLDDKQVTTSMQNLEDGNLWESSSKIIVPKGDKQHLIDLYLYEDISGSYTAHLRLWVG